MRSFMRINRVEKRLTQLTLAELVKVSEQYIYLIEAGKRRPSYEVAIKIASILDFDWTLFYENNDNKNTKSRKEVPHE